ncbi:MAG TPA: endo-1,4-beta-xylanase [Phycisphaerae bacterium]|nr:endo-1,4-beta-xylanase [Phycisphaerae bacterium]
MRDRKRLRRCVGVAPVCLLAFAALPTRAALKITAVDAPVRTVGGPVGPEVSPEGGWCLWSSGQVGGYVRVEKAGTYTVVVRAGGTPAAGVDPQMTLMIDGRGGIGKVVPRKQAGQPKEPQYTCSVKSGVYDDYTFLLKMTPGVHRLTVAFMNDHAVPAAGGSPQTGPWKEDRNLYVSEIRVMAPEGAPQVAKSDAKTWQAALAQREKEIVAMSAEKIEKLRKADVAVRVLEAGGKPMPGAKLAVRLKRHEFLFGCNIYMFGRFGTAADNDAYARRFAELFNYATTGFYWRGYEPKRGQPNYKYTDKVVAFCRRHEIRMKGHPLLWACEHGVPAWSQGQPAADVQRRRVEDILARYKGKIAAYEVVNEPAHLDGIRIDEPYRWARQADPQAYLIVNDYEALGNGFPPFFELLAKAKADGVPFDGVGIQAHEPLGMRFPLDGVKDTLDHYATLGKELHITEFTPTSDGRPVVGGVGKWDEAAQADYAEKFYRVCFAHPAVVAVTWWDLCDRGAWQTGGGMLRKDLSPKPVYTALQRLIHKEWTTHATGRTDKDGRWTFRGFLGRYELTVDGKPVEGQWRLRKPAEGKPAEWTVRLAR